MAGKPVLLAERPRFIRRDFAASNAASGFQDRPRHQATIARYSRQLINEMVGISRLAYGVMSGPTRALKQSKQYMKELAVQITKLPQFSIILIAADQGRWQSRLGRGPASNLNIVIWIDALRQEQSALLDNFPEHLSHEPDVALHAEILRSLLHRFRGERMCGKDGTVCNRPQALGQGCFVVIGKEQPAYALLNDFTQAAAGAGNDWNAADNCFDGHQTKGLGP